MHKKNNTRLIAMLSAVIAVMMVISIVTVVSVSAAETIVLSPESAVNPVGTDHKVIAAVTDTKGAPIVGLTITFKVISGPNAGTTGTAVTGTDGTAAFVYTGGPNAGTDVIQASYVSSTSSQVVTSNEVKKQWIAAPNKPPVANAGPDQTVTVGTMVALDGTGSTDPDHNLPLTYAWTIISQPTGSTAQLSSTTAAKPTFTPDKAGDYKVQLIVKDSLGLQCTTPDTVTITAKMTPTVSPTVTPTTSPTPTVKPSPEFPLTGFGAGMVMCGLVATYLLLRRN